MSRERIVLGHSADVAETVSLALADTRATNRIFAAMDWEHDERIAELKERRRKERDRKRRSRAVGKVKKALGDDYADVVKAWLGGQTWSDIGVPRQTFWDRLKKVKDFFGLENIG